MAKICVTGGSSFVGSHIVKQFLSSGFYVNTTIRTNTSELQQFFQNLPNSNNLQVFEADLCKEGSFQAAFQGCSGVIHVACPYPSGFIDPENTLFKPGVEGTKDIIKTALSLRVAKMVMVSSVVAMYDEPVESAKNKFSEEDWNKLATKENNPYVYTKTKAEEEAWKMVEGTDMKLICINPSMILGSLLFKPSQVNTSNMLLLSLMYGGDAGATGIVDVEDVASSILKAFNSNKSNGRYICSGGSYTYQQISQLLVELFPQYCIEVESDENGTVVVIPEFNTTKIQNELGVAFTPIKETVKKAFDSLLAHGFVG